MELTVRRVTFALALAFMFWLGRQSAWHPDVADKVGWVEIIGLALVIVIAIGLIVSHLHRKKGWVHLLSIALAAVLGVLIWNNVGELSWAGIGMVVGAVVLLIVLDQIVVLGKVPFSGTFRRSPRSRRVTATT
ncbi:MAG TPA: hypothetical protein VLE69_02700 [Candidatus Saccharimonadales bacterium]|nr:hypothetical protein [Candidatus Saccharimonadales bacterium]